MKRGGPVVLILISVARQLVGDSLYDQTVAHLLEKRFPEIEVSFLLMDCSSAKILAERWDDSDQPVAPGSLVKPFLALSYAQNHDFHFPRRLCLGTRVGCWFTPGHGHVGIVEALAHSCNAYFGTLARDVRPEEVSALMARFNASGPSAAADRRTLSGTGDAWKMPPAVIARAYRELVNRATEPGVDDILRGLALSARQGTGREIGRALKGTAALAKTGTAPCAHLPQMPGDGFAIALYPAEAPRCVLLVRVHGSPGMKAAAVAGRMLQLMYPQE